MAHSFLGFALLCLFAGSTGAFAGECDGAFSALPLGDHSKLVNVILSLGFKGVSLDEASAEVQKRRYEELYPNERTVIVSARSADELKAGTANVLRDGERIHRLFVDSHGTPHEIVYGVFDLVFLDPKEPYLQGPTGFTRALSAFKDRFAPDALIAFEGCEVFSQDRNEVADVSSKLLDQFGMKSGRFYANYSKGSNVQDDFLHPKFHDLHDWPSCLAVGAANAVWPLTEALSGLVDYGLSNRGFLYTRVDEKTWCLEKARLMNMRF